MQQALELLRNGKSVEELLRIVEEKAKETAQSELEHA
jgi:hypothetical protein